MNKYFITFGMNQLTEDGKSLGKNYVVIEGEDRFDASDKMIAARDVKWAFCYSEEEFKGQPEKYGLTEVSLESVKLRGVHRV